MSEIVIHLIGIKDINFSQYGQVVGKRQDQSPDIQGEGWRCWYPVGQLADQKSMQIGLVLADLHVPVIQKVESHPTREEWVYAIDTPIVQVIALGVETADPKTAKAVLLAPGEGFIIRAGVWHAPAFAANLKSGYYGFVLAKANPAKEEAGMVPFQGDSTVRIDL